MNIQRELCMYNWVYVAQKSRITLTDDTKSAATPNDIGLSERHQIRRLEWNESTAKSERHQMSEVHVYCLKWNESTASAEQNHRMDPLQELGIIDAAEQPWLTVGRRAHHLLGVVDDSRVAVVTMH